MKPCLFLACCLALAWPARAAIDPFAEFRIPGHSYRLGSAGFDFSANRNDQSTAGDFDRGKSLSSYFDGGFRAGWDSDALQYGFGLRTDGRLMANHTHRGRDAPGYSQRQESVSPGILQRSLEIIDAPGLIEPALLLN